MEHQAVVGGLGGAEHELGADPNAPPGAYPAGLPGGPDARPQQRALENSTVVKLKVR